MDFGEARLSGRTLVIVRPGYGEDADGRREADGCGPGAKDTGMVGSVVTCAIVGHLVVVGDRDGTRVGPAARLDGLWSC